MKKETIQFYVVNFFATEIPNYEKMIELQAKEKNTSPETYNKK